MYLLRENKMINIRVNPIEVKNHYSMLREAVFILEFFGGLVLLFLIGYLAGKILKLDKHIKKLYNSK